MVYLLRAESDTANIQNSDDIRAFRYATCGINGVIANRLNQLGYEIDGTNFTLKSGEIIVDAWQIKVDAAGETIRLDSSSGTRYYSVYVEVDLSISSNKHASILATYATTDYPTIDEGDDLAINESGVARLELYRFEVKDTIIQNVQQMFELLDGTKSDAKKVNNLEIMKDENGVLKIGDVIIPQKKVLWNNNEGQEVGSTSYSITLDEAISEGDILEVCFGHIKSGTVGSYCFYPQYFKFRVTTTSPSGTNYDEHLSIIRGELGEFLLGLGTFSLKIISPTSIEFSPCRMCEMVGLNNANYANVQMMMKSSIKNYYIYKVTKIIE